MSSLSYLKNLLAISACLVMLPPVAEAQLELDVDSIISSAEDWARENLDEDFTNYLARIDKPLVRQFFLDVQDAFQQSSVYKLGLFEDLARQMVPILEQDDQSKPYALWLRSHLDFFETAVEVRRVMETNRLDSAQMMPSPSEKTIRSVWQKQIDVRATPSAATHFLPRLKPIFRSERVPAELVWLAEVESGFNPSARSPVGAVGLFQLMPPTARMLGLQTSPRDERLDPEKNCRAAARYLRHLKQRFGNWPVALAAYNAGETRVANLLAKSSAKEFSRIATRLPAETQLYVPKLEAILSKRELCSLQQMR